MENKEQTAVEWLIKQVKSKEYQEMFIGHKEELFEEAKRIEAKQIKDAIDLGYSAAQKDAVEYYNR